MTTDASFSHEVETGVHAWPEATFAFFTDPELFPRWQGQAAELDPRPDGLYRVRMPGQATVEGTYLVAEPLARVVFTRGWVGRADLPPGSAIVEVKLTPDGDEIVVRLFHRRLPNSNVPRADHKECWRLYLARPRVVVGGGDPGPNLLAAIGM